MKKTNELQFSDTGTVIGTTGFVDGLAEKIIVQLIRRLYLQLDGKILYEEKRHKQNIDCTTHAASICG